jgi:hypothetical protein
MSDRESRAIPSADFGYTSPVLGWCQAFCLTGQTAMAIFPRARPASRYRMASAASASG